MIEPVSKALLAGYVDASGSAGAVTQITFLCTHRSDANVGTLHAACSIRHLRHVHREAGLWQQRDQLEHLEAVAYNFGLAIDAGF
ncbi:MAG TPA: hypothetical protein VF845_04750, partial [Terriglobales bacterium]